LPLNAADACSTRTQNVAFKRGKFCSDHFIISACSGRLEGEAEPSGALPWRKRWPIKQVKELNCGGSGDGCSCHGYNLADGRCGRNQEGNVARNRRRCRWKRNLRDFDAARSETSDCHFGEQDAWLIAPQRRRRMELSEQTCKSLPGNGCIDARVKKGRFNYASIPWPFANEVRNLGEETLQLVEVPRRGASARCTWLALSPYC